MKVLLRIAQYDLVESIKNTISKLVVTIYHHTDYHLSFLKPLKCTVRVFIFRSDKFALPFFPSNVNVCFRGLITRFGAAPPNLQNTLSLSTLSSLSFGLR